MKSSTKLVIAVIFIILSVDASKLQLIQKTRNHVKVKIMKNQI